MNLNPLTWFRRRNPITTAARPAIRARYDNAQTTDENQRNWAMADILSAKAANSFQVRRTLRLRSRYECANNPYLFGVVDNNAADLIDKGPTLQVLTESRSYNRAVQTAFAEWAQEVELTEKLRTLKLANTVDGEGFLVLKTVNDLYNSVKLYPVDIEADQVSAPAPDKIDELWVDGLTLHPITGKPVSYEVMRHHPGDLFYRDLSPIKTDKVSARFIVHSFKRFRPGQVRGVPVFTSALDLFSELRAYRRAILQKAQVAANLTGVLESGGSSDTEGEDTKTPFDTIPIDRGVLTALPFGEKLHQYDTGEPGATYEGFREACLGEACRPLAYPLNLALGTSQKFNFSSAKLDFKNYRKQLEIERSSWDGLILNRIFAAWYEEAVLVPKLIPRSDYLRPPPHEWHWPGFASLDEKVETQADIDQLNAGTQTYQQFWAARGYDWQDVLAQQAREKEELERLELVFGEPLKKTEKIDEQGADAETASVA